MVKRRTMALMLVASVSSEHRQGLRNRALGPEFGSGSGSAAPFLIPRSAWEVCSSEVRDTEERDHGRDEFVRSESDAGDALNSRACFPPCRFPDCAGRRFASLVSRTDNSAPPLSACPGVAVAMTFGETGLERSSSSLEPEGRLFIGGGATHS